MTRVSLVVFLSLLLATAAFAQAPAAATPAPGTKVAVMDFNRAVTETANGKKAATTIMAEMQSRQTAFEAEQKKLEDAENQLRTQGASLNAAAVAALNKTIADSQTNLTRMNEDAQREYGVLQETHFGPIAQLVQQAVSAYATENGVAVVFDYATQPGTIIHYNEVADITTEIIRRADDLAAKAPAPAAAPSTAPRTP